MEESGLPLPDAVAERGEVPESEDAQPQPEKRDSPETHSRRLSGEKIIPWKLRGYTLERERVISKGSLGVFYHARDAKGAEVIAWLVRSRTGTVTSLIGRATETVVGFTKKQLYAVNVVASYGLSGDGECASAMIVLEVADMEKADEFFIKLQQEVDGGKKNRQQKGEGSAKQGKMMSHASPTHTAETSGTPYLMCKGMQQSSGDAISSRFVMETECKWRIKGYIIDTKNILGRGRFGTVYGGLHEHTGSFVAAKVLQGPLELKEKLENETRELKKLNSLNHPNILRLHETLRQSDPVEREITLVHIFELCRGGDLKEFLARHDPLSERQARHLMRQLVECLCVLKANSVMHRDLKPANILLSSENVDEAVLKVADWGMAKSSRVEDFCNDRALFESAVGTVAYMSPERLMRDCYDFQAEVWAAGVIMYELLFARHPYLYPAARVRTPEELLSAITRAEELEMTAQARENEGDDRRQSFRHSLHEGRQEEEEDGDQKDEKDGEHPVAVHLSHDCYDLMRRMLDVNSKRRYTIEQVSAHPWLNVDKTNTSLFASLEKKAVPSSPPLAPLPIAVDPTQIPVTPGTIAASSVEPPRQILSERKDAKEKDMDAILASQTEALPVLPAAPSSSSVAATAADSKSSHPFCSPVTAHAAPVPSPHAQTRSRGFPNRSHVIYQALRGYLHVLRRDVIEEETDPGRALVLLAYAWEMLRVAVRAARHDEISADEPAATAALSDSAWVALRVPHDVRQLELYIQDAAQRQRRRVPAPARLRPLAGSAIAFSTASIDTNGHCTDVSPNRRTQPSVYPTAQALLFQRAVALVRGAATEELMLSGDGAQDGFMDDAEVMAQLLAGRRHAYAQAMGILRLLLQLAVVPRQPGTCLSAAAQEAGAEDNVQVVTVALVPFADEADQRTVQALLHSVEKHYRRAVQEK